MTSIIYSYYKNNYINKRNLDQQAYGDKYLNGYKYLKQKHLESFRKYGEIRVGTLNEYQKIDQSALQDDVEGRFEYSIKNPNEDIILSPDQLNYLSTDYYFQGSLTFTKGTFFKDALKVPNAYIFSFSGTNSEKLRKKWNYDCSYRINIISGFAHRLGFSFNNEIPCWLGVLGKVKYVQKSFELTQENIDETIKKIHINDPSWKFEIVIYNGKSFFSSYRRNIYLRDDPPSNKVSYPGGKMGRKIYIKFYFTKPKTYEIEDEYRIVLLPFDQHIKDDYNPVILKCPNLIKLCDFD